MNEEPLVWDARNADLVHEFNNLMRELPDIRKDTARYIFEADALKLLRLIDLLLAQNQHATDIIRALLGPQEPITPDEIARVEELLKAHPDWLIDRDGDTP